MTKLEKSVLALLSEDARYSYSRIADMLETSEKEVEKVVFGLEQSGIIVKYTAVVNAEKTGEDFVDALIEVRVTPQHSRGFDAIAEEIYGFDMVKSVYLMSGSYDLAVFLEGKSLREVAMFVSEQLSVMDTVISTATHFILKKYKIDGIVLESDENSQRMAVQP